MSEDFEERLREVEKQQAVHEVIVDGLKDSIDNLATAVKSLTDLAEQGKGGLKLLNTLRSLGAGALITGVVEAIRLWWTTHK